MDMSDAVSLIAKTPPGRASRKALAYGAEIARLRGEGYTYAAIRELLASAGIVVSRSTVHREAARQRRTPARGLQVLHAPLSVVPETSSQPARCEDPVSRSRGLQRSRDIAEAFMKDQITNPLMRQRMRDEGSRH